MRARFFLLMLCPVWLPVKAVAGPPDESTKPEGFEQRDVQFTQAAPYSDAASITRHFGFRVDMPDYSITNELFRLLIPRAYSTNESRGLLVWINASDEPIIPADWEAELENHGMLFVSAHHSGNLRHPLDRFRLALDATCNMCRRYKIDRRRIYIAGFSGGARIASMLGVAYADVFPGTLCICGVNFYRAVAVANGKYYPATFVPDPSVLLLGKQSSRFVLLTGEHDENQENTQSAFSEFKREGFRHVVCFEVPGMSHAMPPGKAFGEALDYLADGNK
jgi:predicted esterase